MGSYPGKIDITDFLLNLSINNLQILIVRNRTLVAMCRFYHVIHPFQRLKKNKKMYVAGTTIYKYSKIKITVLLLMVLSAIKFCRHRH